MFALTHTPLWEINHKLKRDGGDVIVDGYLKYKAHVRRQVYDSEREVVDSRLDVFEKQWPNNKDSVHLISAPAYMREQPYDWTREQRPEMVRVLQRRARRG